MNIMTNEELKNHITAFCATRPEIDACYLYGSRATGRERPGSDVDLAFLLDYAVAKNSYSKLKMEFYSKIAELSRMDIHILIMNEAGDLVLGEVLREGVPMFIRNMEALEGFRNSKIPLIAEFTYYSELFRHKLVERYGREA